MGHRSIIWLLSALLSVSASHAFALGLGNVKLNSALNQPLDAEIELYEVKGLDQSEIKVKIASAEDFARIGVDRPYFLSDLTFSVVLNGPGAPMVKVQSSKIVREPFLNFVLQVTWPSGKLMREFTVLLDLPTYSGQTASPVTSTVGTSPVKKSPTTQDYNPRSEYQDAPARQSSAPLTPTITDDSYTVRANDTLWEIAAAVRPDRDVTIHQTMIALQKNNPDAFIKNNINLLKKGQVLRIPKREDIANTGKQTAIREVAIQNSEWSGRNDTVSEAQLSGSRSYDDASTTPETVSGRVKLSSPDDYYDSAQGRTTGSTSEASTEALENELATTLEQLDKSSRENTELRSRVESLQEQIDTMERMLEVSSENLRALELSAKKNAELEAQQAEQDSLATDEEQQALQEQESGANDQQTQSEKLSDIYDQLAKGAKDDDSLTSADDADQADLSQEGEAGSADEISSDASSNADIDAVVESTPEATPLATPTADPKSVVVTPPKAEKSLLDLLIDNVLYLAIGLLAIAVGVFVWLRKKSSDEEEFDEFDEPTDFDETNDGETQLHFRAPQNEDDLGGFDDAQVAEDAAPLDDFEPQDDIELETEVTTEPQTEDVVAEADIYIAYGKFDQAAEMLLKVLAKDPTDQNVRLKLLEVYAAQQNVDQFDPHYANLIANGAPSEVERAASLRKNIIGAPEFNEESTRVADQHNNDSLPAASGFGDNDDVEDELSLDLDLADFDSDGNPDADLDLIADNKPQSRQDEVEIVDDGDDSALDLDFDLDDLDSESDTKDTSELSLDFDLDETGNAAGDDLDDDFGSSRFAAETSSDTAEDDDFNFDTADSVFSADDLKDLDSELDSDLDSLDLDSDTSGLSDDDLDADLAALDADLGTLDGDFNDLDFGDSAAKTEAGSDDDEFDLSEELAGLPDFADFDSDKTKNRSDTVINEALHDDYVEQKTSREADFDLSLDDSLPLEGKTASESAADTTEDEDDLDLSSLDKALDDLTSDLDGLDDDDITTLSMDEPITDFDDFDDELEKDEAMAETVKADVTSPETELDDMGEDTMFSQAIREVPAQKEADLEFELPEVSAEDMGDDDLDFLSDSDETATKLDLARAYIDMGDQEGAREIILEVLSEGNEQQKTEATSLMDRLNA